MSEWMKDEWMITFKVNDMNERVIQYEWFGLKVYFYFGVKTNYYLGLVMVY
jgi:hypothetical protein